jgi:NADPH:quinone reductase-like Zn-dependent oxidoreductase
MTTNIIPTTMRAVEASGFGLDKLALVEKPVPAPKRGEILVQIKAVTLNYRDLAILKGSYKPDFKGAFIPASDGAGTVVAVGDGVTRFKPGDRVIPVYTQGWVGGLPTPDMRGNRTLGVPLDGVLRDFMAVPAEDAVMTPSNLSDAEAATLPIAGLTAWTTLREGRVKPGDWVLVMGTGGVAIFALQFAKLAGARVVVISSSDGKLEKVRQLGADATVIYRKEVDWVSSVRKATGGQGVNIVVETAGTLSKSLGAAAWGGFVGVIGFTGGYNAELDIRQLIGPMLRMQGIAVGHVPASRP